MRALPKEVYIVSDELLCGFCPTFNRPELLGRMIRCFERQSYANRYLVILDDLGQYDNQRGDKWELVSVPRRFGSLGEKNNAVAALAPRGTFALLKMDDDDFYYPWHFEAHAEALSRGQWCQPRHAIDYHEGRRVISTTFNLAHPDNYAYHGQWSYRRDLFAGVGGYRPVYAGDDGEMQVRLREEWHVKSVGYQESRYQPSYVYNRPLAGRISERGGSEEAYWSCAPANVPWVGRVPEWKSDEDWDVPVPTEYISRRW